MDGVRVPAESDSVIEVHAGPHSAWDHTQGWSAAHRPTAEREVRLSLVGIEAPRKSISTDMSFDEGVLAARARAAAIDLLPADVPLQRASWRLTASFTVALGMSTAFRLPRGATEGEADVTLVFFMAEREVARCKGRVAEVSHRAGGGGYNLTFHVSTTRRPREERGTTQRRSVDREAEALCERRAQVLRLLESKPLETDICHATIDVLREAFHYVDERLTVSPSTEVADIAEKSYERGMAGEINVNGTRLMTPQELCQELTKPGLGHDLWEIHLGKCDLYVVGGVIPSEDSDGMRYHHSMMIDRQGDRYMVYQSCRHAFTLSEALRAAADAADAAVREKYGLTGQVIGVEDIRAFAKGLSLMGFGGARHTLDFLDRFFGSSCGFPATLTEQNIVMAKSLSTKARK